MPQKQFSYMKTDPLTEEEIKVKYEEIKEELKEVLDWKKETEPNLEDEKLSPQKRAAAKRAMKKIQRREDTVRGQIIYWKLRVAGESHFKAGIEKNEYWAECNERNEVEKKKIEETRLPNLLKKKL